MPEHIKTLGTEYIKFENQQFFFVHEPTYIFHYLQKQYALDHCVFIGRLLGGGCCKLSVICYLYNYNIYIIYNIIILFKIQLAYSVQQSVRTYK